MDEGREEVNSPCVNKCELNEHKVCIGCGRTIEEIVRAGQI